MWQCVDHSFQLAEQQIFSRAAGQDTHSRGGPNEPTEIAHRMNTQVALWILGRGLFLAWRDCQKIKKTREVPSFSTAVSKAQDVKKVNTALVFSHLTGAWGWCLNDLPEGKSVGVHVGEVHAVELHGHGVLHFSLLVHVHNLTTGLVPIGLWP